MSEKNESMLQGGHPNSLGRTLEIVDAIRSNSERLSELFECYKSDDAVVRLRTSSAFKRHFRKFPDAFLSYIDKFQDLIPKLNQDSASWTFAQLHSENIGLLSPQQKENAVTIIKNQLKNSNDWIVIIHCIEFFEKVAKTDEILKKWLLSHFTKVTHDKRKSVSKRAQKAIDPLC